MEAQASKLEEGVAKMKVPPQKAANLALQQGHVIVIVCLFCSGVPAGCQQGDAGAERGH